MSSIKVLPIHIVKQIAAGEVVESPASVVKELIENSLDAGATKIEVTLYHGGKSYISVTDNGNGIVKEELTLALSKHATSKLDSLNLYNINTMGFRGEALFSIAYVSKITLTSRSSNADKAYQIYAEGGNIYGIKPCNFSKIGTRVEVRDLFINLPARRKFLSSDATEANKVLKLINCLSLAHPHVVFELNHNGKKLASYEVNTTKQEVGLNNNNNDDYLLRRCNQVIGNDFAKSCLLVNLVDTKVKLKLYGYISLPTFSASSSAHQYFFVNKRIIKEKNLYSFLRVAYSEVLEKNRYPMVVLMLDIEPSEVDVNVSPAKTEVKFTNKEAIKRFIIKGIRNLLSQPENQKTSPLLIEQLFKQSYGSASNLNSNVNNYRYQPNVTNANNGIDSNNGIEKTLAEEKRDNYTNNIGENIKDENITATSTELGLNTEELNLESLNTNDPNSGATLNGVLKEDIQPVNLYSNQFNIKPNMNAYGGNTNKDNPIKKSMISPSAAEINESLQQPSYTNNKEDLFKKFALGVAKAQYGNNWIIAENKQGLVIVDQHAAHERIVRQKLYNQFINQKVIKQMLLSPEIIDGLSSRDMHVLMINLKNLDRLGLEFAKFGDTAIIIRGLPSLLKGVVNLKALIMDIVSDIEMVGVPEQFLSQLGDVINTIACHRSIRSGDKLSAEEMNMLLRQIELTDNSACCPHGRPTYVELSWSDIEKIFSRR